MEPGKETAVPSEWRQPPRSYEFGPFCLDAEERRLSVEGRPVALTGKQFDLLLMLVRRSGEVVTKEEMLGEVWVGQYVEESNLTVAMSGLRKALGERYRERKYIETVPKRGYRLTARVRQLRAAATTRPGLHRGGARPRDESGVAVADHSLAVLPFIDEGHDPDTEYLSAGLAEGIIDNLSRVPRLKVMARSVVFRYGGQDVDVRRLARELNVDAILTGRILKFGERLLVKVELVDAEDGSYLWGMSCERPHLNVPGAQEEISKEVSERLRLNLTRREQARATGRPVGGSGGRTQTAPTRPRRVVPPRR